MTEAPPGVAASAKAERAPPPAGSPWDDPLDKAPLAFVDLEMTGLDAKSDHVVEVCIERWVGPVCAAKLTTLVAPPARAGGASHVHGLDADALKGAPTFEKLAAEVHELLRGAVLVAHGAPWDVAFLEAELARAGSPLTLPFYLDTLTLARRAFMQRSYSLDALTTALSIPRGRAHRAEDDVVALRAVFARAVAVLAPVSVRDLWEVRISERKAREAILSACDAAVEHRVAVEVTYRPSRKSPQTLTMVLTEVRRDLDLPRVLGYQLPGRGARDLRADRILRVAPKSP
jgi:DNA polymerase III subunit epsilon